MTLVAKQKEAFVRAAFLQDMTTFKVHLDM